MDARRAPMLRLPRRPLSDSIAVFLVLCSIGSLVLFNWNTRVVAASSNLVSNPGFETGNLSSWSCDAGDTVVSSPVHSGSFALQINPSSSTTGQCTQTISVLASSAYTLTDLVNGSLDYH